jgi:signal transduction histidine kinase
MPSRIHPSERFVNVRAPLVLLGAMLLASLLVSGFTLQLLEAHRTQLDEALRESRAQALDLLVARLEYALLAGMRPPFQVLSGASGDAERERLELVGASFPEVQQIWSVGHNMHIRSLWSRLRGQRRTDTRWLARRMRAAIGTRRTGAPAIVTFVEKLDREQALFAAAPADEQQPGVWTVIQFDLGRLQQRVVPPLLNEFAAARGGHLELQDPEAEWDDEALHEPLTRVLPGWLLSYWPDPREQDAAHARGRRLLLAVSGGAMLVLLVATYAAWRELKRERFLVALRNRFIANISHELKTPLALIRMYAETLYMGRIEDKERRQRYYETILRESERLTDMINAVLDLERLRQGRALYALSATDLAATVRDVLERYRETLSAQGAALDLELAAKLPPVAHDPQGVTQILLNLLNNAREHGGRGRIGVGLRAEGDWVDLAVSDQGPGLTLEEQRRVRHALRRNELAVSARGSGLGLALVEQIAAAHHAYLVLENAGEAGGLRVVVSFPIATGERR